MPKHDQHSQIRSLQRSTALVQRQVVAHQNGFAPLVDNIHMFNDNTHIFPLGMVTFLRNSHHHMNGIADENRFNKAQVIIP